MASEYVLMLLASCVDIVAGAKLCNCFDGLQCVCVYVCVCKRRAQETGARNPCKRSVQDNTTPRNVKHAQ